MENLSAWLPTRPQPAVVRFGTTTAIMALVSLLELVFVYFTGLPGLFLLLIGVFVASVAFDRVSGFYATALATASIYPLTQNLFPGVASIPAMVVFGCAGVALAILSEAMRNAMERALKAEREKDMLFQELSHRMQNNLTMATSLLDLQSRSHANPEVRAALVNAVDRLNILAEGQRHLHVQGTGMVEMQGYIGQVCEHLIRSVGAARAIDFTLKVEPFSLSADKALVIGLVTNELVTNAIKYAFSQKTKGTVTVSLSQNLAGDLDLSVVDNGVGCPDDAAEGFGSKLIQGLVAQHGGRSLRRNMGPGCQVEVVIPAAAAAGLRI